LLPDVTAIGSNVSRSYNIGAAAQRFYRVQALP